MENCCKNIFRVCSLSPKPQREMEKKKKKEPSKKFSAGGRGCKEGRGEGLTGGWAEVGEVEGWGRGVHKLNFFSFVEKPQQFLCRLQNILRLSRL